jgi:iron complex transport system ATP-binding protein
VSFEIENITFAYPEKKVIDNLSMCITAGRFYGIIGPNGCGKSTLLDLMAKHQTPTAGSIRLNGRHLSDYSKRRLSSEVALVPQNFYINFPFTAEEVVMMGRYPHIPRFSRPCAEDALMVAEIMKQTGTDRFGNQYITELSGGERQRVVIARALVQDTPYLFLDEATSNLDINHALTLLNIAKQGIEQNGKTVVAVMQDLNLAALFCDELIFITRGRVAACGPIEDILTPDTIRSVFGVDAKVYFESYTRSYQVVFKR